MPYSPELALPYVAFCAFAFLVGLCLASFGNVVIYRLPRGLSIAAGRSQCTGCGHTLAARDLVPLFSWLRLRGRCRYCGARISPRYMLVELLGGVLCTLTLVVYGFSPATAAVAPFLLILLCIAFIDADTMEIPDALLVALCVPALALCFWLPDVSWLSHGIGLFAVSVPLLVCSLIIKDSFGGGDIKLMAVCGLALGWQNTLVAFFIALLIGGGVGIYIIRTRENGRKQHFPFGPCLAIGLAVAVFWGPALIRLYLSLFR